MTCLEELVRDFDKLDPTSNEARCLLVKIKSWSGTWEEWAAALHITQNGSEAAEIIKKKIKSYDPLHHHLVYGMK